VNHLLNYLSLYVFSSTEQHFRASQIPHPLMLVKPPNKVYVLGQGCHARAVIIYSQISLPWKK
jgi:hypothetical protein